MNDSDTNRRPEAAAAASPYVEFDRVTKSYDGRVQVVDGLDLEVRQGEFLTLLGPSGSGRRPV